MAFVTIVVAANCVEADQIRLCCESWASTSCDEVIDGEVPVTVQVLADFTGKAVGIIRASAILVAVDQVSRNINKFMLGGIGGALIWITIDSSSSAWRGNSGQAPRIAPGRGPGAPFRPAGYSSLAMVSNDSDTLHRPLRHAASLLGRISGAAGRASIPINPRRPARRFWSCSERRLCRKKVTFMPAVRPRHP
jgi:hypothetical protein